MLSPNLETNYSGNSSHLQTLVKDCQVTSMCTVHKETQNNHGGCGMSVTSEMAEFLKKMQEMGRSHIGNALGNVCIANNRNNTYNCNSMSYNCNGTTGTQWSYSEKCWPCQDLNRKQVTKKTETE